MPPLKDRDFYINSERSFRLRGYGTVNQRDIISWCPHPQLELKVAIDQLFSRSQEKLDRTRRLSRLY